LNFCRQHFSFLIKFKLKAVTNRSCLIQVIQGNHLSKFKVTRFYCILITNNIGGVMVSIFYSSAIDHGFGPRSCQTKDYKICICCFSAKHAALRRKNKDWLARNQDNVSEWSNMSIHGLLFQWASTIKIQLSVLV
jgi:hypothetical protein